MRTKSEVSTEEYEAAVAILIASSAEKLSPERVAILARELLGPCTTGVYYNVWAYYLVAYR